MSKKIVPFLIVLLIATVSTLICFIGYFNEPISLDDPKDFEEISMAIQEQHPNGVIEYINIKNEVYPCFNDSLIKLSETINDSIDIINNTRTVNYIVADDSSIYNYVSIFEIEHNMLKDRIKQHLITFEIP